jgi:hypothetical protein
MSIVSASSARRTLVNVPAPPECALFCGCLGFLGWRILCVCVLFWAFCGDVLGCRATSIMTDTVLSRPLRADMPGHSDFPSVIIAEMGV